MSSPSSSSSSAVREGEKDSTNSVAPVITSAATATEKGTHEEDDLLMKRKIVEMSTPEIRKMCKRLGMEFKIVREIETDDDDEEEEERGKMETEGQEIDRLEVASKEELKDMVREYEQRIEELEEELEIVKEQQRRSTQ